MILFVTGTDTGVGKTVVSSVLARREARRGRSVRYLKPVQTGLEPGAFGDADFVARVAGVEVCEVRRFALPLAPAVAARLAGERLVPEELLATAKALSEGVDLLIVEGAGGLLVPLCDSYSMADYAKDLDAELVIATRPSLGTLNHSLLTLEAARQRVLRIAGLVVVDWPGEPGLTERSNLEELQRMAPVLGLLKSLPWLDTAGDPETLTEQIHEAFVAIADSMA